jgi:hypothetical protein
MSAEVTGDYPEARHDGEVALRISDPVARRRYRRAVADRVGGTE